MEVYAHRISTHAIDRFRERVRDLSRDAALKEMLCCLAAVAPNKLRKIERKNKRTTIIKTGCCFFVFSHGQMVTTLKQLKE